LAFVGVSAIALVLALHLGFPKERIPMVLAGFTDTPTFTLEPPTSTSTVTVTPTSTATLTPTSTGEVSGRITPIPPTPAIWSWTGGAPGAPSTGGTLNLEALVWLLLGLLLGGVVVWGLWRPGRARQE
jgi:hypothetical protein